MKIRIQNLLIALALLCVFTALKASSQPAPATNSAVKVYLAATGTIEQLPTVLDGISDYLSSKGVSNKELGAQPESRGIALDELKQKGGDYLLFLQLDFAPGKDMRASLAIQCYDKEGKSLWKEDAKGGFIMLTQSGYIQSLIKTACKKIDVHVGKDGLPKDSSK